MNKSVKQIQLTAWTCKEKGAKTDGQTDKASVFRPPSPKSEDLKKTTKQITAINVNKQIIDTIIQT